MTSLSGAPTTLLVQNGTVTTVTAGTSVTVKSSDGFTATYALRDQTAYARGNASGLVKDATVRILATKVGAKATLVVIQGR